MWRTNNKTITAIDDPIGMSIKVVPLHKLLKSILASIHLASKLKFTVTLGHNAAKSPKPEILLEANGKATPLNPETALRLADDIASCKDRIHPKELPIWEDIESGIRQCYAVIPEWEKCYEAQHNAE